MKLVTNNATPKGIHHTANKTYEVTLYRLQDLSVPPKTIQCKERNWLNSLVYTHTFMVISVKSTSKIGPFKTRPPPFFSKT